MSCLIRIAAVSAAFFAFAAPALAESANCTVTAPEIRVRKSPSKKAKVLTVLKKDAKVTASDKCEGGWVKVVSNDGKIKGYVGGWALSAEAAKPVQVASVETVKSDAVPAPPAAVEKQAVPSNEQLAIQITELRLNVLGLDRDVKKMKKDIQKIKYAVNGRSHKKGTKHSKVEKHQAKKG